MVNDSRHYPDGRRRHRPAAGFVAGLLGLLGAIVLASPCPHRALAREESAQEKSAQEKSAREDNAPNEPALEGRDGESAVSSGVTTAGEDAAATGSGSGGEVGRSDVELSVPPDATLRIIDEQNRPDWVLAAPVREGSVHSDAVCTDPKVSERDCRLTLEERIKQAADDYVNEYLGDQMASTLLALDARSLRQRLVSPDHLYFERIEFETPSMPVMHQAHALVTFDDAFRQEINGRWQDIVAKSRVLQTGLGAVSLLALLGVAFGYFRLDTATRGYYTGRLQFVAAVAILGVIASGVLLARWIPWM